MFDPQGDCWRAPSEVGLEPEKPPVVTVGFNILSKLPEAGWWDVGFSINRKEYWTSLSNVYDPFNTCHKSY
jgi:hypothetical protein